MKTQSAKAKGRTLQKWLQEKLLENFPSLSERDVKSTPMGTQGEDIQLSEAAFKLFPFYVEAKSREKIAIYKFYEQSKTDHDVLLVIKENRKKPLAVVDAELFIRIIKELNAIKENLKERK